MVYHIKKIFQDSRQRPSKNLKKIHFIASKDSSKILCKRSHLKLLENIFKNPRLKIRNTKPSKKKLKKNTIF